MDVKISEDFIANDPRFLDSIFNTSTIDTNLLLAGGLIIIAFVVFELGMFALDAFYNQTYLTTSVYSQRYDNKDDSIYEDLYYLYNPVQPQYTYRDPFAYPYRANNTWNLNMTKIVEWISLIHEAWNFTDSTVTSMDCQKRTICELWRPENGFKYLDKMDLIFKYAEMMNLPDGLLDMVDELSDARQEALDNRETCKEMYSECPSETLIGIMSTFKRLK